MNGRRHCEFFLVRYVPDPVKSEFVNIGVLLREAGDGDAAPQVRLTRDWGRVRCADPDADVEMLEALEQEMQLRLEEQRKDAPSLLRTIEDSFSNVLQISESKACLAESMAGEMDRLMQLYVDARKPEKRPRLAGRQRVLQTMRTEFERAGVWRLMTKRIAAATYTHPGDSLRIDCGYRPNGVVRMFHAVSLATEIDVAKVLAFSAPRLRDGLLSVEQATLKLTAIVEPLRELRSQEEDDLAQYRFGIETMEAAEIRVLTTADLGRVAETARMELRV